MSFFFNRCGRISVELFANVPDRIIPLILKILLCCPIFALFLPFDVKIFFFLLTLRIKLYCIADFYEEKRNIEVIL